MNSTSSGPACGAPIVTNTASSSPAARNDLTVSGGTRTAVHGSISTTSPSKLPCARLRHEEVDLFLDRMPVPPSVRVPLRWLPPAAEALEGDGEVPEAERFAEEANLEMIRIHSHLRRLIRDLRDGDDGVIGHLNSLLPAALCKLEANFSKDPFTSASTKETGLGRRSTARLTASAGLRTDEFRPLGTPEHVPLTVQHVADSG